MSELTDLYQELILDHARRPRNRRALSAPPAARAEGHNPLCGDRLTLYLDLRDGRVADACFEGQGCAISTASASLLTESVRGRTVEEARALFGRVHALLTAPPPPEGRAAQAGVAGRPDAQGRAAEGLGKLAVFSGLSEFPMRVKCASLAWHTFRAALDGEGTPVRTEEAAP